MKLPKRQRKQEDRTVFVLCCQDRYAIEKRPSQGLLADLWQFPNCSGHLTAEEAIAWCEARQMHPTDLQMQLDRHHIFTHIRWDMRCYYIRVQTAAEPYTWLTLDKLDEQAALPTAFRQFREELRNV